MKPGYKMLNLALTKQDEKSISCIIEDNRVERSVDKKHLTDDKPSLTIWYIEQRLEL